MTSAVFDSSAMISNLQRLADQFTYINKICIFINESYLGQKKDDKIECINESNK